MTSFILVLAATVMLLLQGCAVLGSKAATITCQTTDTVTTVVALKYGAVEANPFMGAAIKGLGIPGFIALKVLMTLALLTYHEDIPEPVRAGLNVLTCAAAINNTVIINQVKSF